MCYGMGCRFERYAGDCDKPRNVRCPMEDPEGCEADMEHLEWALDEYYEYEMERRREARHECRTL